MPAIKKISVLGLRGAGKSTFLAVLNLALAQAKSEWRIVPTGRTIQDIKTLMDYIFLHKIYPEQTREETRMEFKVEKDETMMGFVAGAAFILEAADLPGEAVKGVSGTSSIYQNFYENHVKGSSGIIFLLDCKEKWLDSEEVESDDVDLYLPLFSSILAEISQQTGMAKPYVVFCLTKVDQVNRYGPESMFDKEGYVEGIEELAEDILGKNTKAVIDQAFSSERTHWLPVSATGFTGQGARRVSQFIERKDADGGAISGIRNPKDLQPIGVAEAFQWVLDNMANEDEDGRIKDTRGPAFAKFIKILRKNLGL